MKKGDTVIIEDRREATRKETIVTVGRLWITTSSGKKFDIATDTSNCSNYTLFANETRYQMAVCNRLKFEIKRRLDDKYFTKDFLTNILTQINKWA